MTTLILPFHHDDRLAPGTIPEPAGAEVLTPALPEGDRWTRMAALHDAAAGRIATAVRAGRATVLSGDCLVAMAVLAGAQRAGVDPAVVWFDAHGDVHTLETSTSGYLGGLSLRLVLGAHPERLAEPLGITPVAEDRAVLVDARDLDPAEAGYLAGSAIRRSTVADLDASALPDGPLILHVDVDVIDPADLPGLLFPAAGGPSSDAVVDAVHRVLATGRVVVLNLSLPWHPDDDEGVRRSRSDLLHALVGAAQAALKKR
jgi:arginase